MTSATLQPIVERCIVNSQRLSHPQPIFEPSVAYVLSGLTRMGNSTHHVCVNAAMFGLQVLANR
jgi:hypothetical protein